MPEQRTRPSATSLLREAMREVHSRGHRNIRRRRLRDVIIDRHHSVEQQST
jgi:hypothetical protein